MLWSGGGFGSGFLTVTLVKAIDASCGIDQLLFTRKERVASRTDFDVQVTLLGGASLECLAARTADGDFNVFGMNSWFHFLLVTLYWSLSIGGSRPRFQTRYDRCRSAGSSSLEGDFLAKAQRRKDDFLTLRLCAFARKTLRIPFPKHAVRISLNRSIYRCEFEALRSQAAVGLIDFHAEIVPAELFGDDGRRAGAVERIEDQIRFSRARQDHLRQQLLGLLCRMIRILRHRPVRHRQIRPQIRRMCQPEPPIFALRPIFRRAVRIRVRRDHLPFKHHCLDVEVIIFTNSEKPDVFRAVLPV